MDSADQSSAVSAQPRPRHPGDTVWFNALWFQVCWFSCVLGRYEALPLTAALLFAHFLLIGDIRRELRQLTAVAALGCSVDGALSLAGVFEFAGGELLPLWFVGLWLAFATTLRRSLALFYSRPLLAALVGLLVPLNYALGERLGAVTFGYSYEVTLVALAVIWALLLPACYRLARWADR